MAIKLPILGAIQIKMNKSNLSVSGSSFFMKVMMVTMIEVIIKKTGKSR
ncbi:hypothetical protein G9H61_04375 [Aquirufa ecclesiirivi]|uniref:Uncharacterized protein n=1 Tax=Aquirufa ecclesiirivi TaxID=2715124 RepID=A0ABT4JEG7_9BACT|nr:hypothetical protein [Aquirufa ecclesiirivi]MCZ2474666.1 hypothetical protein [Aquirufa ecclesiirivi]